jgi:hypothetical protein
MSSRTWTNLALGIAVLTGTAVVLIAYNFRPTLGAGFLMLAWHSLLAATWFLARATTVFDLTEERLGGALSEGRRAELENEKRLLVKAIKELEFDRDMGKVELREAEAAIARYRARAVEIIRLLDESDSAYAATIEKELARRVRKGAS